MDIFGPLQKWPAAEHIVMLESTAGGGRLEVFLEGKDAETGRFFLSRAPKGSGKEKFTWSGKVEEIAAAQRKVGQGNRDAVLEAVRAAGASVGPGDQKVIGANGKLLSPDTISGHLTSLVQAELLGAYSPRIADHGRSYRSQDCSRDSERRPAPTPFYPPGPDLTSSWSAPWLARWPRT